MNKLRVRNACLTLLMLGVALWSVSAMAHEGEQHEGEEGGQKVSSGKAPKGDEIAVLEVEKFGTIKIRFYEDVAPKTVENFKKLARDGFYNGTAFHRVVPGFMIQGGDPNTKSGSPDTWGMGGPGHTIKAELPR